MTNSILRLFQIIFLMMIFSINVFPNNNGADSDRLENDTLTIFFKKYIPDNFEITDISKGLINEDTLTDYVLITRDSVDWDNGQLIILFQEQNNIFVKSIETNVFRTRYDCTISINNNLLTINSFDHWNGQTENEYVIKYVSNDWYCIRFSSKCGYSENYWENSFDFITGKYQIKHSLFLENDTQIREIKGQVENIKPFSIVTDDLNKHLVIVNHGKTYYLYDRCDLWPYDDMQRLINDK